jgi:hypothetical protein
MRESHLGVLAFVLLCCGQVQAQEASIAEAQITWYGVYKAGAVAQVDDPASPSGKRYVAAGIEPPAPNSESVPFAAGTRFGFGYVLTGVPADRLVTLTHVRKYSPPGMQDEDSRPKNLDSKTDVTVFAGRKDLFIAMNLGDLKAWQSGDWTFEVWYAGRKLAAKTFAVRAP